MGLALSQPPALQMKHVFLIPSEAGRLTFFIRAANVGVNRAASFRE